MNIVIYKDNLSTGRGADHLICAQAEGLAGMGHNVTLVTNPTDAKFTFKVASGVKVEFVVREDIRAFVSGFDVCIAAGSNEILDLTLGGKVRPPVKTATEMLVAPSGFFKWKRFIRNRRIKKAFNLSDALVILCPAYEIEVRRFAPDPEIVNIAEWPDVREPAQEELRGDKRKKTIIYPAAINRNKNQLLLIEAFGALARDFPDWQLHIYGKANKAYGTKCRKAVAQLGIGGQVTFLPFTDDLPSVYASAEIMAFPSLLEGFPLAMIEGMKFGVPAVVVDTLPGAKDMIEDGENGIIAPNTPDGYADALRRLMTDGALRRSMGEKARLRCNAIYTKERIIGQWDELVKQLYAQKEAWQWSIYTYHSMSPT